MSRLPVSADLSRAQQARGQYVRVASVEETAPRLGAELSNTRAPGDVRHRREGKHADGYEAVLA